MDESTIRFIHDYLDSRTKLEVALFLHRNRFTLESADGLARRIGRAAADIARDLQELAAARVVTVHSLNGSPETRLYGYTEDGLVAQEMQRVADACDGPERSAVLAHVLQAEGRRGNTRQAELASAESLKSQFLSLVSHELRTPLAAIKGYVELLQAHPNLDAEQRERFLDTVAHECDRLAGTLSNLLLAAEMEHAESWECLCQPIPLRPLLDRVVGEVARRYPEWRFHVDPVADCIQVLADEMGTELVIRNLLDNAAKFSRAGSTVRVWTEVSHRELLLHVGDEGVGISPDRLRSIFERFYQTEPCRTRRAHGAGLGLYLARRVMERMSGRIAVRSDLGRGSVFTCAFVLAAGRECQESDPGGAVTATGAGAKLGGLQR